MLKLKGDGRQGVGRGRRQGIRPQSPTVTPSNQGKSILNPRRKRTRIAKRQKWGVK